MVDKRDKCFIDKDEGKGKRERKVRRERETRNKRRK